MRISDWSSDVCSSDLLALLCAICVDQAMAADGHADAFGQGTAPVAGGSRPAGRTLRVHPVRLLFHILPQLLVELRPLPRPGAPAAGLSLAGRQQIGRASCRERGWK